MSTLPGLTESIQGYTYISFTYNDATGRPLSMDICLDASVSEVHSGGSQVTEHQIEKGSNVTDHIRPLPAQLSIEAVITNTPILNFGSLPNTQMNGNTGIKETKMFSLPFNDGRPALGIHWEQFDLSLPLNRVGDVYGSLQDARSAGAVFSIVTSLGQQSRVSFYQSMAMTSLSVPRNAQSGNSIRFTMEFRELKYVQTSFVSAPSKALGPKHDGQKPTTTATPQQEEPAKSVASAIFDKATQ